jgi:hypothetical protein
VFAIERLTVLREILGKPKQEIPETRHNRFTLSWIFEMKKKAAALDPEITLVSSVCNEGGGTAVGAGGAEATLLSKLAALKQKAHQFRQQQRLLVSELADNHRKRKKVLPLGMDSETTIDAKAAMAGSVVRCADGTYESTDQIIARYQRKERIDRERTPSKGNKQGKWMLWIEDSVKWMIEAGWLEEKEGESVRQGNSGCARNKRRATPLESSCARPPPTVVLDASTQMMKGREKSGKASTGAATSAALIASNAASASSVHSILS